MKTLKYSIIALLAVFATSCSSDDVENRPVVEGTDAPVLLAPEEGNVYVLTEENADVQAERFIWTAANFGEGIIPSYDIEIDYAGQDFDTPVVLASTTNGTTQVSISNNVLNSAMETLEAPANEPGTFNVRIKAYVADMVMYSNAVEISVTPYEGEVPLPFLYLVGSATETGWDNATGGALFREVTPEGEIKFYYTGYLMEGELKFLSSRGAWQPQYGGSGGVLAVNPGTGSDPAAIAIAANGYYTVEINLTAMTYSVTAFDASAAVVYPTIGLIGDATPTAWDSDTDMVNSTANPHIWKLSTVTLGVGGAKFRANDAWTINWGSAAFPTGVGTQDGPNIAVDADHTGDYEVWFNDLDGRYIFIPAN